MTGYQRFQKRAFDVVVSFFGLLFLWWLIVVAALLAYIDTGLSGFFKQERVGRDGRLFKVIKIRSMRPVSGVNTSVTTDKDPRISKIGRFWRKTKIDELPQLWNVLMGNMSFVGPRPDVPGYADKLEGEDRLLLSIRPGITGPASIKFKNEEEILASQQDPEKYNREVIWPEKVKINLEYIKDYSLFRDIGYIFKTVC
ncbi:Sugar transferase involved in LPS biosynthesis (colanic, teichoic acid) [Sinomicrobium oceani]|uniref:Sugar transferase involved in LPS biosynthesis (Colanic, teichoic acid) n=1 Tax=Sinomicrobium oceani TaxID=1150368 RepID=A0A1K1R0X5_9FLAO|nr:sugar transferase [Sinomicrobium oceani]SFW65230.1 Sugar transferase involved in LPS biosynthesis (colanic, teichoic acid) [Sinomicrobium oceani]